MIPYSVLNALPPEAFLDPNKFRHAADMLPEPGYKVQQFQHGKEISDGAKAIHISANSVWSADMKNGSYISSSEGIGYHSCTGDLLAGFLAGSAAIVVHRWNGKRFTETTIRPAKQDSAETVQGNP